ncbi:MAG: SepM family pheromone-processing serine protease, partial [Lactiplantibacillus plantarum]
MTKGRELLKRYWGLLVVILVVLALFLIPLPYYIEGPGSA